VPREPTTRTVSPGLSFKRAPRMLPLAFSVLRPSVVVRQNSVGTLNPVLLTMLQAAQHAIHLKRILNFGEGQRTHFKLSSKTTDVVRIVRKNEVEVAVETAA